MTEVEERIFNGDFRVVVCTTSRVVKMKEHLSFCRESSILCVEDRFVVDRVV